MYVPTSTRIPEHQRNDTTSVRSKWYLQVHVASTARNYLLVVNRYIPFFPKRDCIVISKKYSSRNTNINAHPAEPPLLSSFLNSCTRYFSAVDMEKTIKIVFDNCFNCAALHNMPHTADNRRRRKLKLLLGSRMLKMQCVENGNTFNRT